MENFKTKDFSIAKKRLKSFFKSDRDFERVFFNDLLVSMDELLDILEEDYGVDVSVDDIDCNGWQMDFLLPVCIHGSQYSIEGSGYYRRLALKREIEKPDVSSRISK